ncbi:hypothetical protein JCM8097_008902 [Rhodosporidiobolus ruineniae]
MLRASLSVAALVAAGSSVNASPISARAAASIPQTVGDYTYKGCYSDLVAGGARVLSLSLPNGAHTVEGCVAAAKAGGYSLAGIEYYGECWVGNELDSRSTDQGDAACNLVCWGDSTEFCGGQGGSTGATMQLYSLPSSSSSSTSTTTTTTTTSTNTTSAAATATPTFVKSYSSGSKDWTRQSCQSDLRYGTRALPNQLAQLKSRTVEGCLDACTSAGYSLCGVEWDGECWGANSLDTTSITLDDAACNKVCADDATEICGGTGGESGSAFQLFKAGASATTTSATPSATAATGLKEGGSVVETVNSEAGPAWSNNGCYGDLKYGTRALSHLFAQETTGTVEACVNACQEAGYSLCGVEYQGECWGGDSIDSTSSEIDASVCNLACSGDNSQRCGGSQAAGTPGIAPFGASFQLYVQCGDNVATCNLEEATSCSSEYVLYDGACDDTVCPDGWFNDRASHSSRFRSSTFLTFSSFSASSDQVCKQCNSVDKTCTSLDAALTCIDGHVLYKGKCDLTSCPTATFQAEESCFDCGANALTCSSADIVLTCEPNFWLTSEGACVATCPSGTFGEISNNFKGSAKCTTSGVTTCVEGRQLDGWGRCSPTWCSPWGEGCWYNGFEFGCWGGPKQYWQVDADGWVQCGNCEDNANDCDMYTGKTTYCAAGLSCYNW